MGNRRHHARPGNSIALAEFYGVTLDNLVKFDAKKSGIPIPPKGKHFLES